jgi:gliding motility-associated-like protein
VKKLALLTFLIILATPSLFWARHIVGGDITYRIVSSTATSNRYEFTMRIYRDCNTIDGSGFDPNAVITTYRKSQGTRADNLLVPISGPAKRINAPILPCLTPPVLCVEEGEYRWTRDLPIVNDTYIVVYQRCCRNNSINNIINPGGTGASYTVEITALAQLVGNNSPTFKVFPPTVICANYPLVLDQSAVDTEGDQLVYRFCEPYSGGSTGGTGCASTAPNPACWPPNGSVTYRQPDFTFQAPIAGDPIVSIDPNTGRITGTPNRQGQFVVSICVEEYRQGKLLSVLKRDFQFNVAPCTPNVVVNLNKDTIIDKTQYFTNCGENFIKIVNTTTGRNNIFDFRFEVDTKKDTVIYREWEPTVLLPDTGRFKGKLLINPGTQCADTVPLQFNIYAKLLSNFTYVYDTCIAGPVAFKDVSRTFNGVITKHYWNFGDGRDTFVQNPTHLYTTPGTKKISLKVTDSKGCTQDTIRQINWQPVPPLVLFQPSSFSGCSPAKLTFTNLSRPIDSTYDIRWTFGDGGVAKAISPSYIYQKTGIYSLNIDITSPIGCKTSRSFKDIINIYQGSTADFEFAPEKITQLKNNITFLDKSLFATRWQWQLNDKGFSSRQNPAHSFRDTGIQRVKLFVSNQYGCTDTITKLVDVVPEVVYFLPNAFTPNNDTNNDVFKGAGIIFGVKDFSMKIWNRWGQLIYNGNSPSEGWNGKMFNTGAEVPEGIYSCVVTYTLPRGGVSQFRSFVTLIR